jgi:uncharacterized tellurite resistance protein B-like protein
MLSKAAEIKVAEIKEVVEPMEAAELQMVTFFFAAKMKTVMTSECRFAFF